MASAPQSTEGGAREGASLPLFTAGLVLLDAVPVALFGASCLALGTRLESTPFLCGAAICVASGAAKVLWKLLVVFARRDVRILSTQLRYAMSCGFLLMIGACALEARVRGRLVALVAGAGVPSIALACAWVVGMGLMFWFGSHFPREDVRANWLEEATNALAQACLLAAVLLLR